MRLVLEVPSVPHSLCVRACQAAEEVLAERGVSLSQLSLCGTYQHKAEQDAYKMACAAAVLVLVGYSAPPSLIEHACFKLVP